MKHITAFLLLLTASIACGGIAGFLTQKAVSWRFIQSVGGMKVSLVENALHVDCDVSGLKEVTVKPTTVNSGIGVRELRHKQVGKTIQLSVVTSVIEKGMTTSCKPLDLSSSAAGEYSVEYINPDGTTQPLGKITLAKGKMATE